MGWIEDLKNQKIAEEQARLLANQNAERERKELDRRHEEEIRTRISLVDQNKQKIKEQVEQTGIRQLAQKVIDAHGALELEEKGFYMRGRTDHTGSTFSYDAKLIIRRYESVYVYTEYVGITVSLDGAVTFLGAKKRQKNVFVPGSRLGGFKSFTHKVDIYSPLEISIDKKKWQGDKDALENALGKMYMNPMVDKYDPHPPQTDFSHCLPGESLISVPSGFMPVRNLKNGDLVWTVDRFGQKVQEPIVRKIKRRAVKNHKVAHIVLEDGRELIVSSGHPTIDNKELGSLKTGQFLDQSKIISLRITPYREKYTYDILPSGDTGAYWANDILIGSTLFNQFKQVQWSRQLLV